MERYFVYRLIPPRPTFHLDMSAEERETMNRHVAYWRAHTDAGRVVVFGPVIEPEGSWGLGVIRAPDDAAAQALVDADPAISSGMATMILAPMAAAVLPG
jgi:uncharacterized protein YciI